MVYSAYIHIPFCKSKCKYCSFVSFVERSKIYDYIDALLLEIDNIYQKERLKTLYFGGGTPSILRPEQVQKIIQKFNFADDKEITFEINPDDANKEYLLALKKAGVNRISMGSQTFDDKILKNIGRRHSSIQVTEAVKIAQEIGFENISLDLIYGLPEQDLIKLKRDLEIIEELNIKHISTYGLKIEEESYWGKNTPINLPDEDAQADMYLFINEYLHAKGFYRYEISNFAKKGYESKHNLNYWHNNEYYGFGVAAHGYVEGKRFSNTSSLEKYINNPLQYEDLHEVSVEEQIQEEIFLGFRKEAGLNITKFNEKFSFNFEKEYKNILKKYVPDYIERTDCGYKLTLQGVLLSNNILADFI